MVALSEKMLDRLRTLARREKNWSEDDILCGPGDLSGGNYDDAWSMGGEDAERSLAQEVLTDVEEPW